MQKKITGSTITVPVPNHDEIKKGTLKSIIRQSNLSQSEFEIQSVFFYVQEDVQTTKVCGKRKAEVRKSEVGGQFDD